MPYLDDRRFQDLVDDAKRLVAARCPEWIGSQRLRPGRHAHRGIRVHGRRAPLPAQPRARQAVHRLPRPASARRCTRRRPRRPMLVMWLAAPRDEPVVVPEHTEVGTPRTEQAESIVFHTTDELEIPPRSLRHIGSRSRRRADVRAGRATPQRHVRGVRESADGRRRVPARPRRAGAGPRDRASGWTARSAASASTRSTRRRCGSRGTASGWSRCDLVSDRHGRAQPARRGRGHRAA